MERTRKQDISSSKTHSILQSSSTLNRRYVRRPTSRLTSQKQQITKSSNSSSINTTSGQVNSENRINITFRTKTPSQTSHSSINRVVKNPYVSSVQRQKSITKIVVDENNKTFSPIFNQQAKIDQAFSSILSQVDSTDLQTRNPITPSTPIFSTPKKIKKLTSSQKQLSNLPQRPLSAQSPKKPILKINNDQKQKKTTLDISNPSKTHQQPTKNTLHKKGKRLFLAFFCSASCVTALFFIIQANMPDISIRVAAMQTGIQASYPNYVPRDYKLSGVHTNQDNSIAIEFTDSSGGKFTLTEEKLPWDSTTLLNRFVKTKWIENYDTIREQGITIYTNGSNAAWVNAGIVYKITTSNSNLTKKQIKNIVTSL